MARTRQKRLPIPPGYRSVRKLGKGAQSVVWEVQEEAGKRRLALKMSAGKADGARLLKEFAILERVEHPGIVKVYDSGEYQGHSFFTMELLKGSTFDAFASKHLSKNDSGVVFDVLGRTALTLAELHRQGVVHADLKPTNLVIKGSEPVLLDFGFAEDYVVSPTREPRGTLDYTAPELFFDAKISPAADIYSLGAMAYQALAGRLPWEDMAAGELIASKLRAVKSPWGKGSGLSRERGELILRMLEPDPGRRPSAVEVADALSGPGVRRDEEGVKNYALAPRLSFGGRQEPLETLGGLVFESKRTVIVEGPAGIGKTRLLREFRFRALAQGRKVVLVSGRGGYLSLVEHLAFALGVHWEQVPTEEKERRYERIYQGVIRQGLEGLMIDAPSDLSPDELACLGFLARGLDKKVGLVLTGGAKEAGFRAEHIELEPLSSEAIGEILSRSFEDLTEVTDLARTLASAGEGNPGRMVELTELLFQQGWLYWEGRWFYQPKFEEDELTEKLQTWVKGRIDGLPAGRKKVLKALSLTERPVPQEVLSRALGGQDILLSLMDLNNQGLVDSMVFDGTLSYQLASGILRNYTFSSAGTGKRKTLARALAKGFEESYKGCSQEGFSPRRDSYLVQLAGLYHQAGSKSKASTYLFPAAKKLVAANQLDRANSYLQMALDVATTSQDKRRILNEAGRIADIQHRAGEAEEYYSKALSLTEGDDEARAELFLRIGLAYQRIRKLDKAGEFFKKSERVLDSMDSRLSFQLLSGRGWNAIYTGEITKARRLFTQALKIASSAFEQKSINYSLAWVYYLDKKYSSSLRHAEDSLKLSRESDDEAGISRSLLIMQNILKEQGKLKQSMEYAEEVLALTEEMEYPVLTEEAMLSKAYLLSSTGRVRQARDLAREGLDIAHKLNDTQRTGVFNLIDAQCTSSLGDWQSAERVFVGLWRDHHKEMAVSSFPLYILRSWADVLKVKGEFKAALGMLAKAERLALNRDDKGFLPWIKLKQCEVKLSAGDYPRVRQELEDCLKTLEVQNDVCATLNAKLLQAELLLLQAEHLGVAGLTEGILAEIEEYGFEDIRGEALRLLGKSYVVSGRFKQGLARLHESLEVFKKQEKLYQEGITLFALAEAMFDEQGYSQEAIASLEEAQRLFERIGATLQLGTIQGFCARHFSDWREQQGLSSRYLDGLKQLSELINYRLGEENFMLELLALVLELTGADRGMIFLMEENELFSVASKRIDTSTSREARHISRTVIQRMRQGLRPIYTPDATSDGRFNRSQSILLNDIHSLMCIPLRTEEKLLGTIYLDSRQPGLFDSAKALYFESLGNLLAATIDKSDEFKRLREELLLSRKKRNLEKSGVVMGTSVAMRKLYSQLERIAPSETTILLEGETGTGKGVFARTIHERSLRREREFCSINCGILPEQIFESELFGHRKGAYTGASQDRIGLLEAANGSTVFFDEITNTSPAMQAKLLEVIEERVIRRLGEPEKRNVDLRFIFATNRDLKEEVREQRFREDLYFRISAVSMRLPPLRERREDIPEFVDFFLKRSASELNKNVTEVADDVMQALLDYPWPGNIRELANVIERAVLLARGRRIIPDLLDQRFFPVVPHTTRTLQEAREIEEKELIRRTLLETRGNVTRASRRLGISRQHLTRMMKTYQIPRKPEV